MIGDLIRGVRFAIITMALFGGAYPLVVWGVAQTLFRDQAQGSLVARQDGSIMGSTLIAQSFDGDAYVHSRPSGVDYNAASTGGTNYGATNPDHLKAVGERIAAVRAREALASGSVPADLVTAGGAGLDPHLSPAAVDVQVARVARVRGTSVDAVRRLVAAHTESPTLGVLGRPRVNVLQLNLALDAEFPIRVSSASGRGLCSMSGPYRAAGEPTND
jgi:K+-transporting ATPase ATPase C chain